SRRLTVLGLAIALGWVGLVRPARSAENSLPTAVAMGVQAADDDPAERGTVPVPEPSPKAVQYHRSGLWIWAFAMLWDVAVPALILISGLSARMRNAARKVGRGWYFTVALYVVLFLGLTFLADLPFRYVAGFLRQHAYGLSNQTLAKWLGDSVK